MPTITLKNIPIDLYDRVKQSAAANHRSINSEVIVCLERAFLPRKVDVSGILDRARKIRELTDGYVITDEEINRLKRAGRL
ncbi:MAG: DNA-binding protein [Chloroflexi bacterium RBG_16_54_18]|nr:MAG: DNA-binding protein [Chloroflexi bacterium RBG_16_54_18]